MEEERYNIYKGNLRGTKKEKIIIKNQKVTLSKRLDIALINRAKGLDIINKSK